MKESMRHDAAVAASKALVAVISQILLEWERQDCQAEFYKIVRATLECCELESPFQAMNIRPSLN
jgi:hypothetical protein